MAMHTVKQLARISGVSVRTLHYYDETGLLRPAQVGANGYRYYGTEELLRLQQILLHRELGLPLDAIASLLESDGRDRIERLREHRQVLEKRTDHYRELIATVDRTITALEGEGNVDIQHLYKGFSAEKQAEYETWIVDTCSKKIRTDLRADVERSRKHVAGFSKGEIAARMKLLADIEAVLADHCRKQTSLDHAGLQALLVRHREWVAGMWGKPCSPTAYAGLADLYASHPDFRTRYETLAPGLADYLPSAMKAHAARCAAQAGPA